MSYISYILFLILLINFCASSSPSTSDDLDYEFDPNGYVIFCLCMGRFGNQAEHFLGAMSFAKHLNRTLVVPPFITYKNIPYSEWFRLDKLSEFHRIISAEAFMQHLAPKYWPPGQRHGFCWLPPSNGKTQDQCQMMFGNPSTNYWKELGVEQFDKSVVFSFGFFDYNKWKEEFPSNKYPVIALKGAPASYPMMAQDRINQKYMLWSDSINEQADDYIKKTFNNEKFLAIHLRNGPDWDNACKHITSEYTNYMASPQCLDNSDKKLSKNLCLPSKNIILDQLEYTIKTKLNKSIRHIYVATDKDPMLNEIKNRLNNIVNNLNVVFHDPWLPVTDLAIMTKSDYFIGNCVSSFTSFVKRYRDVTNKESTFWTFY